MRLLLWLVGALAILMIASCKVTIYMPLESGLGKVNVDINNAWRGSCRNVSYIHEPCISSLSFDAVDFHFDMKLVATPAGGYRFKEWKKGNRRLCGGSSKPCRVTTTIFTGDWIPVILPFLENMDEEFYVEPVFEKIPSAISCSVYAEDGMAPFCAAGKLPSCAITRAQGLKLAKGMTYSQVVNILGCHGDLTVWQLNYFADAINWGHYWWGKKAISAKGIFVEFSYNPDLNDEPTVNWTNVTL